MQMKQCMLYNWLNLGKATKRNLRIKIGGISGHLGPCHNMRKHVDLKHEYQCGKILRRLTKRREVQSQGAAQISKILSKGRLWENSQAGPQPGVGGKF